MPTVILNHMDTIQLTQQLISIKSYVDSDCNEAALGNFLFTYCSRNLPWLTVTKQLVEKNRYNILALPSSDVNLLFICHMDTVKPSISDSQMCNPIIKNNKLYGLGSADMKGGTAAAIKAIEEIGKDKKVGIIFDCDEEYYFKGAMKLLQAYSFTPKLLIFPEPTDCKMVNKCRGIVEIAFDVIGKTAHAGDPSAGVNAIEKSVQLVHLLKDKLEPSSLSNFKTTINLSAINGGRRQNDQVAIQANAIPDIAKVLLDIRPADSQIDAECIFQQLKNLSTQLGITLENLQTNINYRGYESDQSKLNTLIQGIDIDYSNQITSGGFFEAALFANKWNRLAISLGPTGQGHIPDENVDLDSIRKCQQLYQQLVEKLS